MDALLGALAGFVSGVNSIATVTYNNAVDCFSNASAASASASAAAASASAAAASASTTIWVSGTTYAIGNVRFSPINFLTYRRKTAGAGTTDPSADGTNWQLITAYSIWIRKTTTYSVNSGESIKADTSGGAWSMTFPASPGDGDQIEILDIAGTFGTSGKNLTLLSNGKKIMGFTNSWVLNTPYFHQVFTYDSTLGDWRI